MSTFIFVVDAMFNLGTFSLALATVSKILLLICSILYLEMYIHSLNVECKI